MLHLSKMGNQRLREKKVILYLWNPEKISGKNIQNMYYCEIYIFRSDLQFVMGHFIKKNTSAWGA